MKSGRTRGGLIAGIALVVATVAVLPIFGSTAYAASPPLNLNRVVTTSLSTIAGGPISQTDGAVPNSLPAPLTLVDNVAGLFPASGDLLLGNAELIAYNSSTVDCPGLGAAQVCVTVRPKVGTKKSHPVGTQVKLATQLTAELSGVNVASSALNTSITVGEGFQEKDYCFTAVDDDSDGKVNDGCPAAGTAETGAECDDGVDENSFDTAAVSHEDSNGVAPHNQADVPPAGDKDRGAVNDGCPAVGTAESPVLCTNAADDDGDGRVNDGCPAVDGPDAGTTALAETEFQCQDADDANEEGGADRVNDGCGTVFGSPPTNPLLHPFKISLASTANFPTTGYISISHEDTDNGGPSTEFMKYDNAANPCTGTLTNQLCIVERARNPNNFASVHPANGYPQGGGTPGRSTVDLHVQISVKSNANFFPTGTLMVYDIGNQCANALDDDLDGFDASHKNVNDGCPAVNTAESGTQCDDALDANEDGGSDAVNDGCPAVGTAESNTSNNPVNVELIGYNNAVTTKIKTVLSTQFHVIGRGNGTHTYGTSPIATHATNSIVTAPDTYIFSRQRFVSPIPTLTVNCGATPPATNCFDQNGDPIACDATCVSRSVGVLAVAYTQSEPTGSPQTGGVLNVPLVGQQAIILNAIGVPFSGTGGHYVIGVGTAALVDVNGAIGGVVVQTSPCYVGFSPGTNLKVDSTIFVGKLNVPWTAEFSAIMDTITDTGGGPDANPLTHDDCDDTAGASTGTITVYDAPGNTDPTGTFYDPEVGADCANNLDDDNNLKVNDGCPAQGPETLAQCDNAVDDDGDGKVNDGCPAVLVAETGAECNDAVDENVLGDDGSSSGEANDKVNDGCPTRAVSESGVQCNDAVDAGEDGAPDKINGINDGCPAVGADVEDDDTDGDGCGDWEELGSNQAAGGWRDPFNPFDFMDPDGNKTVNVPDILAVASAYGDDTGPNYTAAKDRGTPKYGPYDHNRPEGDGVVNVFDDILVEAGQFGNTCGPSNT